jgi:hypothetical protein
MGWVLRFVEAEADSLAAGDDVIEVSKRGPLCDIAHLGLTLAEAKQLLARVQQVVVAAQAKSYAASRPVCSSCNGRCHIHDWRPHQVATLFGVVAVRFPRFRCAGCGHHEAAAGWPSHCRSTPEMDQLRAHLSALMPYRGRLRIRVKSGHKACSKGSGCGFSGSGVSSMSRVYRPKRRIWRRI